MAYRLAVEGGQPGDRWPARMGIYGDWVADAQRAVEFTVMEERRREAANAAAAARR